MPAGKPKKPKTKAPEELESIWDDETAEAWNKITPRMQDFFIEYLSNGFNKTQAYRTAYKSLANDNTCGVNGFNTLRNSKIQVLCAKLRNSRSSDLLECYNALRDGLNASKAVFSKEGDMVMEIPDHKTRIDASMNLLKAYGELVEKVNHSGTISIAEQILQVYDKNSK